MRDSEDEGRIWTNSLQKQAGWENSVLVQKMTKILSCFTTHRWWVSDEKAPRRGTSGRRMLEEIECKNKHRRIIMVSLRKLSNFFSTLHETWLDVPHSGEAPTTMTFLTLFPCASAQHAATIASTSEQEGRPSRMESRRFYIPHCPVWTLKLASWFDAGSNKPEPLARKHRCHAHLPRNEAIIVCEIASHETLLAELSMATAHWATPRASLLAHRATPQTKR